MTVERILNELELLLSDFCFAGLRNAPPGFLHKLEELQKCMETLGMTQGADCIAKFTAAMQSYHLGDADVLPAINAMAALEFYCKSASGR